MARPSPLESAACAALGWLMLGVSGAPARGQTREASLAPPAAEQPGSRSQDLDRVSPAEALASPPSEHPNSSLLTIPPIADPTPLATKPGESAESGAAELEMLKLGAAIRISPKDSPERAQLTGRLKAAVEAAFDLRQKQQLADVQRLEIQLSLARERIDQRRGLRDQIVERRILGLIGDDNLEWEGYPLENLLRPRSLSNPQGVPAFLDAPSSPEIPPADRSIAPPADPEASTGISTSRSSAAAPLASLPRGDDLKPEQMPDPFAQPSNSRKPFDIYAPPDDLISSLKKAKTEEERSALRARFRARKNFLEAELKATALELKGQEDSPDASSRDDKKAARFRSLSFQKALQAYENYAKDFADPDAKPQM